MFAHEAVSLFIDHLYSHERSRKTVIGYQSDLRNFERYYIRQHNGPWIVEDTVRGDIEGFLHSLKIEKGLAPASRNRILTVLKKFFELMVYKEVCRTNVAQGIEPFRSPKKEKTFLTEAEVEEFLAHIEHPVVKVAATTLANTGLRISECCNLRIQDVDLERRVIHVINGKGKRDRTIPINDKLYPVLFKYLARQRTNAVPANRFFATEATGQLSPSHFNRVLIETSRNMGLSRKVTAHEFRHSFASNLVRNGANIVQVQKLMGHSSLQVTSVYTHATLDELADAVNRL